MLKTEPQLRPSDIMRTSRWMDRLENLESPDFCELSELEEVAHCTLFEGTSSILRLVLSKASYGLLRICLNIHSQPLG